MGYDLTRFEGAVDEELLCPICGSILEEPVQTAKCEHAFCKLCIKQWLRHQSTCPVDRGPMDIKDLTNVPRILKNLLSKLSVRCDHVEYGCHMVVRLEHLNAHSKDCEFNPKRPIVCSLGCNVAITKLELKDHNCIRELRKIINDQQSKIFDLSSEVTRQKADLAICISDLRTLKGFAAKYFRVNAADPSSSNFSSLMSENDEVFRWSMTLLPKKVTKWGGIISTPDAQLQTSIRRALVESNCPTNLLTQLMKNAHEHLWPPGLNTLETRQLNRNHYDRFVCKGVSNKQAVLILACDNAHMPDNLITEPGCLFIFAHGVE